MSDPTSLKQRMMDKLTHADLSEADAFAKEVYDAIKEPNVRVPENVFREIFLGAFTAGEEENVGVAIAHWMGIVESPTAQADVYDMAGNVLFTVPPIFETSRIDTDAVGPRYSSFLYEYADQAKIHPALAQPALVENMEHRLTGHLGKSKESPYIDQWKGIFQRYGLINEDNVNQNKPAASVEDDFE